MQAPIGAPSAARSRPGLRIGEFLWSRKLLLLAVVLAAMFAFGSIVFAHLQSDIPPASPTFLARITLRGAGGGFDAVTAVRGDRSGAASCTVEAFDVYGQTIGTKVFDLERMAPGEPLEWRGRLRVEARVEWMNIDCRWRRASSPSA